MPTHSGICDLKKFSQYQTTFKIGIDMMDNMPKEEKNMKKKKGLVWSILDQNVEINCFYFSN